MKYIFTPLEEFQMPYVTFNSIPIDTLNESVATEIKEIAPMAMRVGFWENPTTGAWYIWIGDGSRCLLVEHDNNQ